MDNPAITVVLTVCDRPFKFVKQAVDGILNQTFKGFELCIINNNNTLNLELDNWIKGLNDCRISYINLDKYMDFFYDGEEYLKMIFSMGRAEYIIWTHDDDIMQNEMLEREKEVLDLDENIAMVCPNVKFIDSNGDIIYETFDLKEDIIYDRWMYINQFLSQSKDFADFSTPAILFRRKYIIKALDEISNKKCSFHTSVDALYKICINTYPCKMYIIKDKLYYYRIHEMQGSVYSNFEAWKYMLDYVEGYLWEYVKEGYVLEDNYNNYFKWVKNYCNRLYFSKKIDDKIIALIGNDISETERRCKDTYNLWKDKYRVPSYMSVKGCFLRVQYLIKMNKKEYLLWGTGSGSEHAKIIIDYLVPGMVCTGYIDSYKTGIKDGLNIYLASDYKFDTTKYIIVAATTAENDIDIFLQKKGLEQIEDYMPQFLI